MVKNVISDKFKNIWIKNDFAPRSKNLDITDWRIILIIYLSIQMISYVYLLLLSQRSLSLFIGTIRSWDTNIFEVNLIFDKNLLLISNLPIYFLIILGLPFLVYFYVYKKNQQLNLNQTSGLRKFLFTGGIAFILIIVNALTPNRIVRYTHYGVTPIESIIYGQLFPELLLINSYYFVPSLALVIGIGVTLIFLLVLSVNHSLEKAKKEYKIYLQREKKSKYCPHCGMKNLENSYFCAACGEAII